MPSQEQVDQLRSRLETHRQTLAHYLSQRAQLGAPYAPPGVEHGIREARAEIRRIKEALRGWGEHVEDWPDDAAPAADAQEIGAAQPTPGKSASDRSVPRSVLSRLCRKSTPRSRRCSWFVTSTRSQARVPAGAT